MISDEYYKVTQPHWSYSQEQMQQLKSYWYKFLCFTFAPSSNFVISTAGNKIRKSKSILNLPKISTQPKRTVRHLIRCDVLTAALLKIQVFWDVTLSAWWAVLQWVGAIIFKVKHSQKNASFLDSQMKMTLWSYKHWVFLIQKYTFTSQTTWIFYRP